ncbi:MAG: 2-phosphosulfolactate phosphatase [Flavobacteriales bacterium]|nr:2-phosphosulfolactate phosphatase [Flavobacteriales bacterium]
MNQVEVCFSPPLFDLFAKKDSIVVVVDIFRATSAMVTAFQHGARSFIPVSTIKEALDYKAKGYLAGGERNGEIVKGFEFGNSPFAYMDERIKDQDIVLTTTNGTRAINIAKKGADTVLIGSFLNLQALADHLQTQGKDVIIFCAGWKDRFNMEDSLFAGALTNLLLTSGKFYSDCDSANASSLVYRTGRKNLMTFLKTCSHRKRLAHLNLEKDVEYCLQRDVTDVIPVLKDGKLVRLTD